MIATAFSIFRATQHLPKRNGLPAWADNTKIWPQVLLLTIGAISLLMSVIVMVAYCRHGHHRAEKVAAYYTVFAVGFFVFSIIMWAVGAAVFNQSKAQNNNKDMWGWSCVDNKRRHLFEDDVSYALVCRLQVSKFCFPVLSPRLTTSRTGLLSAASSKSSLRSLSSPSTASSSTDFGPRGSSGSPWLSVTVLDPTSTLLSFDLNQLPTLPALDHFLPALAAGAHHQATPCTSTLTLLPRMARARRSSTPTLARLLNLSHSPLAHPRSRLLVLRQRLSRTALMLQTEQTASHLLCPPCPLDNKSE
jgi:hypothetical protein